MDTHATSSVHHAASLLSAYRCIYRLAFLIALPRFASRPAPRVVERGDVVSAGACGLLRDVGDVDVMRR